MINVPAYGTHLYSRDLIEMVKRSGSHFFDADTMRFFESHLHDVFAGPDGWYFITSEKHTGIGFNGHAITEPRKYTVRRLAVSDKRDDLDLTEYEGFQVYPTLQRARTVAKRLAETGATLCADCHCRIHDKDESRCAECQERRDRQATAV